MKSRDIALSSLFGLVIFSQKLLLPGPYDKFVSLGLQITLLCLAFLTTGVMGPILTSMIAGVLTAAMRGGMPLMTFTFALLYGVLVSVSTCLFHVVEAGQLRRGRLMGAALISTLLAGIASSSVTIALGLMPFDPSLVAAMLCVGGLQGLGGGYLSSILWTRYFPYVN
ncbi:hypothetical protein AC480_05735 [miscellaneous Crenarchaeota group archaeon SMTZ1-55]|nr:MAG: hypothetical protein AC480_05735 [miscellaneous Crenarchaeota group archaeon SMTZ1-55]